MDKKKDNNRILIVSLWIIPLVFYLAFWALDGAVWCADSDSYVRMYDSREPLYPTLLALLRMLCGVGPEADPENNLSLTVMALIQSILAGLATGSLATFLAKTYLPNAFADNRVFGRRVYTAGGRSKAEEIKKRERLLTYILLLIPLGVSLLNRFAASRASMYSNSIMTEGIAISLYLLAFRFILDYMIFANKRAFKICCFIVFAGITLRKQMFVLLCLLCIAMIYRSIVRPIAENRKNKEKNSAIIFFKGLLCLILSVTVTVGASAAFDCIYNKIVRGSLIIHTEDNRFVTTMAFYTAEREYVEYIDPQLKEIYLKIYDECDRNKWLMHDAPHGWYAAVDHFADNYDHIQLDTMQWALRNFVSGGSYAGFTPNMTETEKMDAVRYSFNASLLPHENGRLLTVFANNLLNGLVNTVAKKSIPLCIYALVIYLVFICMALKTHGKKNKILVTMTVLSLLGNLTLVSAVIFSQTRYMIYNMPIFYMTLLLLMYWRYSEKKGFIGKEDAV